MEARGGSESPAGQGGPPPAFPGPGGRPGRHVAASLALSLPLQAAFLAGLAWVQPWGPARARAPRAVLGVVLAPLPELLPPPGPARPAPAAAPTPVAGAAGEPGGSWGSRVKAPVALDTLGGLPDPSGMAALADLPASAPGVPPGPSALRIPEHPLGGAGYGRGSGTGEGDGHGAGKGTRSRTQLARMAAEGTPLPMEDFKVLSMTTPRYAFREDERGLQGSVVVVRLLLDADGVPLFVDALSGPEVLVGPTLIAARRWRFLLAAHVRDRAPVPVVIRYRWVLS